MTPSVAEKIDELLKSDATFTTRAGVRFMTEVIRDAFEIIENTNNKQGSIETRLGHVEVALNEFLELRKAEQKKAEAERTRWRWAIITPTIGLFFTMLGLLLTLWLRP